MGHISVWGWGELGVRSKLGRGLGVGIGGGGRAKPVPPSSPLPFGVEILCCVLWGCASSSSRGVCVNPGLGGGRN